MKHIIYILISILLVTLQSTIFTHLDILGILPNLILCFVVCVALIRGSFEGGVVGVVGGILFDLTSRCAFGTNALALLYIGIICGIFTTKLFRERYWVAFSLTLGMSLFSSFIYYLLGFFVWGAGKIDITILLQCSIEGVYTAFFAFPLFFIVKKLNNLFIQKEV